jgi:hypothetical protein
VTPAARFRSLDPSSPLSLRAIARINECRSASFRRLRDWTLGRRQLNYRVAEDTATQRLASLIAIAVDWTQADARAIADRLIKLLPRRSSSKVPLAENAHGLREMTGSAVAKMLICVALGVTGLIIAASREPSSRGDHADAPAFSTTPPPQTSRPSSR